MADISLTDPGADIGDIAQALAFNNLAFRTIFGSKKLQLPGGGPAVCWGTGVPSRVDVANGDWYLRVDGAAGACLYQRRAGAWAATGA